MYDFKISNIGDLDNRLKGIVYDQCRFSLPNNSKRNHTELHRAVSRLIMKQ